MTTEHHLEFLSLKWDCTGSSESTLVKMPHCWVYHVVAQTQTMRLTLIYVLGGIIFFPGNCSPAPCGPTT